MKYYHEYFFLLAWLVFMINIFVFGKYFGWKQKLDLCLFLKIVFFDQKNKTEIYICWSVRIQIFLVLTGVFDYHLQVGRLSGG